MYVFHDVDNGNDNGRNQRKKKLSISTKQKHGGSIL